MNRRVLCAVSMLMISGVALLFSAGEAETPAQGQMTGSITFMVLNSFAKTPDAAIYAATKDFESQFPGASVTIEPMAAADLPNKYTTAVLAGGGPDVVSLTGIADYALLGIFEPLDSLLNPMRDQYYDGALNSSRMGGKYYGVPWYMNNAALYYNRKLLAEVGIGKPPANWDELASAIEKVAAIGKKGLSIGSNNIYWTIAPFFMAAGSTMVDSSSSGKPVVTVNNEGGKKAFQYFCELHTRYNAFPESAKDAVSWDYIYAPFIRGDCAFMICGDWGYLPVKNGNPDLDFDIAPMPAGPGGKAVATLGGYGLAMNPNSAKKELAWEYMKYLISPKGNDLLLAYNRVSARKDVDTTSLVQKQPQLKVFVSQNPIAREAFVGVKGGMDLQNAFNDAFKRVYLQGVDWQTALAQCEKDMNNIIDEKYGN